MKDGSFLVNLLIADWVRHNKKVGGFAEFLEAPFQCHFIKTTAPKALQPFSISKRVTSA
jgi:hypothetical protein